MWLCMLYKMLYKINAYNTGELAEMCLNKGIHSVCDIFVGNLGYIVALLGYNNNQVK